MPVQPPTCAQLERIAAVYRMQLTEDELATFSEAAGPTLAGFRRLDELPDEVLPVAYPRADAGHRPTGEENPSNGWAWRCSIPGAAEGPLAGRTAGVKGKVCGAGASMLNGPPVMGGCGPRQEAPQGTPALGARAPT